MKLTRSVVTVDHGIYGKKDLPASCKDGLALIKLEGRAVTWRIYHALTGITIGSAGDRRTKEAAKRVMASLLDLPLEWEREDACTQVGQHLDAVKCALQTA